MSHNFIVKTPESEPIQYVIHAKRVGVGRGRENEIRIDHGRVSTHHLEIVIDDEERCSIKELGSANGTLLNGLPMEGVRNLRDGDRLVIGEVASIHYLQFDHETVDLPGLASEFSTEKASELYGINEKVCDLKAQAEILGRQYEEKLSEFQQLLLALEKMKDAAESEVNQNSGSLQDKLDEAKGLLAEFSEDGKAEPEEEILWLKEE